MAKAKRSVKGLAAFKRVNRNASRASGGGAADIASKIAAYGGGFVASNVGAYVVRKILEKKLASLAKALGPVGAALVFGGIWYGADKVRYLRKYRLELLVGSGLAVLQHALAATVPSLAWLAGGSSPTLALPAPAPAGASYDEDGHPRIRTRTRFVVPGEVEQERAEESINNGTYGKRVDRQGDPNVRPSAAVTDEDEVLPEDVEEMVEGDAEYEDLQGGIFAQA